ncbi:hypothetical protein SapgrDRAFT_0912 [Saprospira grandis DSM 2844]|uniref:Pvc16 N-terminal domain-containing protein n=1 Tax=Saprospira grandis DSM 2844 TaxID=694433 RepID=J0NYR2_9BACT|nr:DUF4255 domain-containing protein [Saprospira grandis]EJF52644.1 hypothetical protein SapgrDRAFT_0912 [Saprospira grandis DSM 2844]
MIDKVVTAVVGELNRFLQSKHNILEEKVIISHLVNADGSMAVQEADKIVMTIINIEAERNKSSTATYQPNKRGNFTKVTPPVEVNIYMLFSAYFTNENYLEGLKFVSSVIAFFQSRQGVFNEQNTPALSGSLSRLVAEMVSPDFRDISNVWNGVGAKYLPSVLYRFKTIPIEHKKPEPEIPSIRKI